MHKKILNVTMSRCHDVMDKEKTAANIKFCNIRFANNEYYYYLCMWKTNLQRDGSFLSDTQIFGGTYERSG